MSSIFDEASFIWGGNAPYQNGFTYAMKPLTGNGQIPFTRNSNKWVVNKNGILTQYGANEIAQEYDANGNYLGALIEPSATNFVRNNTFQGIDVGYTIPVNSGSSPFIDLSSNRGLNVTVVGKGDINGIDYIDVKFEGTTTSGGGIELRTNGSTTTIVGPSTSFSSSHWIQLLSGTPPATSFIGVVILLTAGGFSRTVNSSYDFTKGFYRAILNSATNADESNIRGLANFQVVNGTVYDFTIRIGLPQLELGTSATSPIKTFGAAVTREDDVLQKGNFGSLVNVEEGTIVVEYKKDTSVFSGETCNIIGLGTATSQRLSFQTNSNNNLNFVARKDSVSRTVSSGIDVRTVRQLVGTYSNVSGLRFYVDGVFVGENTTQNAIPVTLNAIQIGKIEGLTSFGQYANANIALVALFKRALTDTEIANLPRIT
jgi:hypothetical protein